MRHTALGKRRWLNKVELIFLPLFSSNDPPDSVQMSKNNKTTDMPIQTPADSTSPKRPFRSTFCLLMNSGVSRRLPTISRHLRRLQKWFRHQVILADVRVEVPVPVAWAMRLSRHYFLAQEFARQVSGLLPHRPMSLQSNESQSHHHLVQAAPQVSLGTGFRREYTYLITHGEAPVVCGRAPQIAHKRNIE